ncbi:hypothetical protein GCM10011290_10370 [Vogesella alkaliphila]|uniref:Uncharacterized protein n=1 Tax=Vogesella alkaliphila TaxID=1193621 RepID=A0ABQ2YK07_9NEIS|nr:hypothetical protein GCM10011290_10370 [Vogesella alkaliphila]
MPPARAFGIGKDAPEYKPARCRHPARAAGRAWWRRGLPAATAADGGETDFYEIY